MSKKGTGIKWEITLIIVALILVVVGALSLFSVDAQKKGLTEEVKLRGLSIAKNLASNISDFMLTDDELSIAKILSETMNNKGVKYAFVVNKKGVFAAHNNMEEIGVKYNKPDILEMLSDGKKSKIFMSLLDGEKIIDFGVPAIAKGRARLGVVHVGVSYKLIEEVLQQAYVKIGIITIAALLLGIVGAFILAVTITKPISVLAKGAKEIGTGNLDYKIVVKSKNELGALANIFNMMTVDLKRAQHAAIKQEVLRRELEVAKEIQLSLIPKEIAEIKGYEVAAYYGAAKEVGGDYYDVLNLDENKFGITVADVSGKGVPAAFIMTMARSMLHSEAANYKDMASNETLKKLNKTIFPDIKDDMFITFYYGLLDITTNELDISSAGHNDTLVYRAASGEVEAYNPKGFAVGMDPGARFDKISKNEKIILLPGDQVVAFTDGISEAMNEAKDEFGDDRLIQIIKDNGIKSTQEVIDAIMAGINDFVQGYDQSDDIALVVLKKI